MSTRSLAVSILLGLLYTPARADDVLYRYEGDVLPYDESAGWLIFDPCEGSCAESVEEGHFVLSWLEGGNDAYYHLWIARPPDAPPPLCGSSGASGQPSPSAGSSTLATGGSGSITGPRTMASSCSAIPQSLTKGATW